MQILLHPRHYSNKSEANNDIEKLSYELPKYKTDCSIDDLAQAIENGQAFVLATSLTNKRNNASFAESELIGIDIDKAESVEAVLDKAHSVGLEPAIGYYTMSQQNYDKPNPPDSPKSGWNFRLIFQLDEAVEDGELYRQMVTSLALELGSDKACTDLMRIFFGSRPGSVFIKSSACVPEYILLGLINKHDIRLANNNNKLIRAGSDYECIEDLPKHSKYKDLAIHVNNWQHKLLNPGELSRYVTLRKFIVSLFKSEDLTFITPVLAVDLIRFMLEHSPSFEALYGSGNWKYPIYEITESIAGWADAKRL